MNASYKNRVFHKYLFSNQHCAAAASSAARALKGLSAAQRRAQSARRTRAPKKGPIVCGKQFKSPSGKNNHKCCRQWANKGISRKSYHPLFAHCVLDMQRVQGQGKSIYVLYFANLKQLNQMLRNV